MHLQDKRCWRVPFHNQCRVDRGHIDGFEYHINDRAANGMYRAKGLHGHISGMKGRVHLDEGFLTIETHTYPYHHVTALIRVSATSVKNATIDKQADYCH